MRSHPNDFMAFLSNDNGDTMTEGKAGLHWFLKRKCFYSKK